MMNANAAQTNVEWQYNGDGANNWHNFPDSSGSTMAHIFDLDIRLSSDTDGLISATCRS